MKLTMKEIEAGKSKKGGYTRAQLAEWGVPWPPPHGWVNKLLAGDEIEPLTIEGSVIRPEESAHEVLHKVVMAVISHNHAADLYDFPDVLAYFGAQLPAEESAYGPATKHLFQGERHELHSEER